MKKKKVDKPLFIQFVCIIMVLLISSIICVPTDLSLIIQGNNACSMKGCSAYYLLSVPYRSLPFSVFLSFHDLKFFHYSLTRFTK